MSIANLDESKEEAKRIYLSWIKNAVLKSDRSDIIAKQIVRVLIETAPSDINLEQISKKLKSNLLRQLHLYRIIQFYFCC